MSYFKCWIESAGETEANATGVTFSDSSAGLMRRENLIRLVARSFIECREERPEAYPIVNESLELSRIVFVRDMETNALHRVLVGKIVTKLRNNLIKSEENKA